jgi:hypothetical protein
MPIYRNREREGMDVTPAQQKSEETFNSRKDRDLFNEEIGKCVEIMMQKVRDVSPSSGEHSGNKPEEYWYSFPEPRYVMVTWKDFRESVIQTDYLPLVERVRSGSSHARALGVITVDGCFYPIRRDKNGARLNIMARDKNGLQYPIDWGLEDNPQVIADENEVRMGNPTFIKFGTITFSFMDPKQSNFNADILASLKLQIELAKSKTNSFK